jgi:L-asparaginase II
LPYDTTTDSNPAPVLVELTRGGIVEVVHRGHFVVWSDQGGIVMKAGNPDFPTFLRSSAKPLQAADTVLSGAADRFGLSQQEIAVIAGSHGGERIHTETVGSILSKIGLHPGCLQCGIHPPLDLRAKLELDQSGAKAEPIHHNCSGKHTGMLATCRHLGYSIEDYLNPEHPVQQRITSLIGQTAGVRPEEIIIGIDGCSAPVHAIPLVNVAISFARLAEPKELAPGLAGALRRVASAMQAFPEMVGATQARICTELIKVGGAFGLVAKAGAEGVYAVGWKEPSTGRSFGLAVKMEDGQQRGRDPVTIEVLQRFGVLPRSLPTGLEGMGTGELTNWRKLPVGVTRVVF